MAPSRIYSAKYGTWRTLLAAPGFQTDATCRVGKERASIQIRMCCTSRLAPMLQTLQLVLKSRLQRSSYIRLVTRVEDMVTPKSALGQASSATWKAGRYLETYHPMSIFLPGTSTFFFLVKKMIFFRGWKLKVLKTKETFRSCKRWSDRVDVSELRAVRSNRLLCLWGWKNCRRVSTAFLSISRHSKILEGETRDVTSSRSFDWR